MKVKLKKGDEVKIIAGKDRGKRAKVLRVFREEGRVIVEGINMRRRRERARKAGQKGQVIEVALPIAVSNVALWCEGCARGVRVGAKATGDNKNKWLRICRRCEKKI